MRSSYFEFQNIIQEKRHVKSENLKSDKTAQNRTGRFRPSFTPFLKQTIVIIHTYVSVLCRRNTEYGCIDRKPPFPATVGPGRGKKKKGFLKTEGNIKFFF